MAKNRNLNSAAKAKKDKFYTQLDDIAEEVRHYKEFFKGKSVLCNCDDPFESNFFQYFALMFNALEIKRLVTTSYADSPIAGKEISLFPDGKTAYMTEATELRDWNGDGREDLLDVKFAIEHGIYKTAPLEGDHKYCAGDFRSKELIALLEQADVVVTNPPFSVFREYVAQLLDAGKKFLIIGNKNALTYKEIFPLIKDDKLWGGFMPMGREIYFDVPQEYIDEDLDAGKDRSIVLHDGRYMARSQSIWFTNIEAAKFREDIPLYKKYSPEENPRYDNYDAIEVSKTAEIPEDYFGVMGVPITFLDKYNPNQFEILGHTSANDLSPAVEALRLDPKNRNRGLINGQQKYDRILIRRRHDDSQV